MNYIYFHFIFSYFPLREEVIFDFLLCLKCFLGKWKSRREKAGRAVTWDNLLLLVTLQFLVVFCPVRLAPPQGTSVVPRNTALNHSVSLPSLQHVEPGPQEVQVLFLGAHVSFPSGFFRLHLRQRHASEACRQRLVAKAPQGEG